MQRYSELDILRTAAITGMVLFHVAYDLAVPYGWHIDVFGGAWHVLQVCTASLFLLLVGTSFAVSAAHAKDAKSLWKKQLRRFLIIGACALAVTIATFAIDEYRFVRFGILHLIALSSLLLVITRPLKEWSIAFGVAMVIAAQWIAPVARSNTILLAAGWHTPTYETFDYFPLMPWFGIVLIGYGMGYAIYVRNAARRTRGNIRPLPVVEWMSRHSLAIYLVHQPIAIALLWMLLGRPDF